MIYDYKIIFYISKRMEEETSIKQFYKNVKRNIQTKNKNALYKCIKQIFKLIIYSCTRVKC